MNMHVPRTTTLKQKQMKTLSVTVKLAENSFQCFSRLMSLMGHYNHSILVDANIMVSTNCPIIGEQVAVNFVAQ